MKKALEYRERARDCRALAARAETAEQRDQLLQMATHWETMAADRAYLVEKSQNSDDTGKD
jgi:hypothetical protein